MSGFRLLGPEHVAAWKFCTAEGDYRAQPELTAVHVRASDVEAANGHIAIRVPLDGADVAEFPKVPGDTSTPLDEAVLVKPDVLMRAAKATNAKGRIPILRYVKVGAGEQKGSVVAVGTDLESAGIVPQAAVGAQFPDLDKVLVSQEGRIGVSLQARYLKIIAEYAIKASTPYLPLVQFWIDPKDAECAVVRFEIPLGDGREAVGAIMPMRRP